MQFHHRLEERQRLCRVCYAMFTDLTLEGLRSREALDFKQHHPDFQSFQPALKEKCLVCSTIRRCLPRHIQSTILEDPAHDMI